MRIDEVTGDFQTVRTIMYNYTGDKAVYHNKKMRHFFDNVYVGECELDSYGQAYYYVFLKWPECDVALYAEKTNGWRTDDEIARWVKNSGTGTKDDFIRKMKQRIADQEWIKLIEIEALRHVAPELVTDAFVARDACEKRREAKRAERELAKEQEDAAFVEEANKKAADIVNAAVNTIRNGGVIQNDEVCFWKTRYDFKKYSVINYLMGQYGVDIPIRTKGWITERLVSVTVYDGHVTVCRWMRSGRGKLSDSFWEYMTRLVNAVRDAA